MTEFGFIDIAKALADRLPKNGFEGIGDDCAVLAIGADEALVFTADLVVEDIHFLGSASAKAVAIKALNVNLSDVASMGVRPVATLLSVALPEGAATSGWAEEFIEAYTAESERWGVALIGGDTTASKDRVTINVTAIGRGKLSSIKRRSDAKVGDVVCVTGKLGGSARGLRDLINGRNEDSALRRHLMPQARIEEGKWLGNEPSVGAMMDISDGMASDLRHILNCSGVGAAIDLENIPIDQGATLDDALSGGEDYELLLTVREGEFESLSHKYYDHFGSKLYAIGRIVEPLCDSGCEISWRMDGKKRDGNWRGFSHY